MLLKELLEGLEIVHSSGDMDTDVESIAYDSRNVKKGSLFVCIEGFKTDGHDYIPAALENGAKALLVQKEADVPLGVAAVRVKDTRYALAHISDVFFNHPSTRFSLIGVTGTKGKTTTTFMIKAILEQAGQNVGLIGTIANYIGNVEVPAQRTTPESYDLQKLFHDMNAQNVNSVVMEVSSHALDLNRVGCCDFDIGIFTNLSQDHLDFHETFENYLNAKIKLFEKCKKGLVNIDNEYGREVVKRAKCEILTFSIEGNSDIRAVDVQKHPDHVEFTVVTPWERESVRVNIPGVFSVYNALGAIGACRLAGIPFEAVKAGLEKVSVPGRAEIAYAGKDFTVMIDYAHSPDSLENILTTVKSYSPGRLVSLFGCGGDRDRTKRPIMGGISGRIADFTIITSDNPRSEAPEAIIKEIEEGIKGISKEYVTITERRDAIRYAMENAKPKDIIVLAGKGHETYQIFKDKTIHFDEREVVQDILKETK